MTLPTTPANVSLEAIIRPTRDILAASTTMNRSEVRFMVDAYYQMQEYRKASTNQVRSLDQGRDAGPEIGDRAQHATLDWMVTQVAAMERQVARALDIYSGAHVVGPWLRGQHGIGPVIAAGLIAHIEIDKCPTVGHIWRFAGLDPTCQWAKGERRPWNARLKTLCWKIGQSFVMFSNAPSCYYGQVYRQRKAREQHNNDTGQYAEQAAQILTRAPHHAQRATYATGRLPDGHIDMRARRYAVKLFLAHLHEVWWTLEHDGQPPPAPYPIAHGGHAHYIAPPKFSATEPADERAHAA